MLEFVATAIRETMHSFVLSGTLMLFISVAFSAFGADRISSTEPAVSTETVITENLLPADHTAFLESSIEPGVVLPRHMPLVAGAVISIDGTSGRIAIVRLPQRRLFDNDVMVLDVVDRNLLLGLSKGDKVRFDYEHLSRGWVLTRLEHSN